MASARFGMMFSCFRSVSVSQRMSLRLLAVSGRMTVTACILAGFALAPLRFVRATVFVFDFFMVKSPFDLSVQFKGQIVRFGKCTKLFRSIAGVIFLLPCLVPRLAAVLDMLRRALLSF